MEENRGTINSSIPKVDAQDIEYQIKRMWYGPTLASATSGRKSPESGLTEPILEEAPVSQLKTTTPPEK